MGVSAAEEAAGAERALELRVEEPRVRSGGGTVVRVFGRGFTADAPVWCRFGTTGPIPAEYASEGAVRCKSPAKATASRIPVEVSRGNTLDLTTDAVLFSV